MFKAYKYRIYPTEEQKVFFAKTFGCCRLVWNLMLTEKQEAFKNGEIIHIPSPAKYKNQYPFLREVDSRALGDMYLRLAKAYNNHFKNKSHFGLPQFKKKKESKQSYTTYEYIKVKDNLLKLPKLKSWVKIKLHRPFSGIIKSTTITKTPSGKYYASITVETDEVRNKIVEPTSTACGIDLGISTFATVTNDSGSQKIDHPHYLKKSEKKLTRLQRQLFKKKLGSSNREKARLQLAKYYEYVGNMRKDFLHKLSKAVIDENQVITVEDLDVKSMLQNKYLAKSISDSSWTMFVTYLEYKAQWYGRKLIKVDRYFPSTQLCSNCGYINKALTLSDREWTCPQCGTHHDRDITASVNLYKVGLAQSDLKPVEIGSVDDRKMKVLPKKQPIIEAGN
jgi:putative transposase